MKVIFSTLLLAVTLPVAADSLQKVEMETVDCRQTAELECSDGSKDADVISVESESRDGSTEVRTYLRWLRDRRTRSVEIEVLGKGDTGADSVPFIESMSETESSDIKSILGGYKEDNEGAIVKLKWLAFAWQDIGFDEEGNVASLPMYFRILYGSGRAVTTLHVTGTMQFDTSSFAKLNQVTSEKLDTNGGFEDFAHQMVVTVESGFTGIKPEIAEDMRNNPQWFVTEGQRNIAQKVSEPVLREFFSQQDVFLGIVTMAKARLDENRLD